ncbi:unnamed protein product [Amaranthus hypochondriacus]
MLAIVHCPRVWEHYLEAATPFKIKTYNRVVSHLQSQQKLSSKQARWLDYHLSGRIKHQLKNCPRKPNQVAYALSQKVCLAPFASIPAGSLFGGIKNGLYNDPQAQKFIANEGKKARFDEDGALYAKETRFFVPTWDNLRREILRECHDTPYDGHQGTHHTLAMVQERFYWWGRVTRPNALLYRSVSLRTL